MAANVPNEVEEAMKSILSQDGVDSYVIYNAAGVVVRSEGLAPDDAVALTANTARLLSQTKMKVEDLMQQGDAVELLRLKTTKYEIIISAKHGWTIVVLQRSSAPVETATKEEEEP